MDALYTDLDDDKTQNFWQFVPYKATSYVAKGPVGEKTSCNLTPLNIRECGGRLLEIGEI